MTSATTTVTLSGPPLRSANSMRRSAHCSCELAHRVLDGLVADHVGEAVGAEQVTIAGAGFAHGERRLDLVAGQRPHDQGSLRVRVCLFGGDPALVDQRLNERVVAGDLRQVVVAQQVARESPMCTRPSLLPEKRIAVSVVPMPSSSGSSST